jgi:hypothetical protein
MILLLIKENVLVINKTREELVNKEIIRQLTFEEIGENSDNEAMRASVVLVYGLTDKNF